MIFQGWGSRPPVPTGYGHEHQCFHFFFSEMDKCVTYEAVLLFKFVIAFCFLGILCSLFAFILDLVGPKTRALKLLRRNAILSIITGKSNHVLEIDMVLDLLPTSKQGLFKGGY